MRLDEWQKWLDSQFLDATPEEPSAPAQTSSGMVDEPFAPAPVEAAVPDAEIAVAVKPPVERSVTPVETDTTELPPAQQPTAPPQRAQTDDMDVPSIEQYLPFLRQKAEAPSEVTEPAISQDVAAVASSESNPREDGQRPPTQKTDEPAADGPAAAETSPGSVEPAPVTAAATLTVPPSRALQPAVRRGRQARNVRPKEGFEEFVPEMLWSLVPKHIQVLVAMGSDDVPQNSYKRSFKESRIELISHLLDPTLSLEDTARLLNVCPTTVRRYTNRGLLTHHRTPGDQRRFKLSDVLAFLEAQTCANPAGLSDV